MVTNVIVVIIIQFEPGIHKYQIAIVTKRVLVLDGSNVDRFGDSLSIEVKE